MKQNLIIIDSPALCHRAKHAMKNVELSFDEMKTEIIFNFLNDVLGFAKRFDSDAFAFAWDSKLSYRAKLYPQYKWKRREEKTKEEKVFDGIAYTQFHRLRRDVLPALGFKNNENNFIQTGLEADDIIASLVKWTNCPMKIVVSRDNDLWQFIGLHSSQWDFQSKKMMTRATFQKKYGINSYEWRNVKAIAGCTTDNVSGIEGVGPKTAVKYLLKTLPEHHKTFKNIESEEGQEIIKRNKPLVSLPFEGTKDFVYKENILHSKDFYDTFEKLNFQSFTNAESFREWEDAFNLQ